MEHLLSFYYPDSTSLTPEINTFCKEIIHKGTTFRCCTFPGCGKIFRYKSESVRHRLIHTPQKPFECPFPSCGKTFKREDALKIHTRVHTGETPYTCEELGCGRSFSSKSALRYHSLKHKGEKEYKCSFPSCDKKFLTMAQLRSHEKAFNCHKKISPFHEDEECNLTQSKIQKCEDIFAEPDAPMRFAKELQWESKNPDDEVQEEEKMSEEVKEEFERIVKAILKENNMMKKKLNMCNEPKGNIQETQGSEFKPDKFFEIGDERQLVPPEFSDENIFAFLKFDI